LLGDSVVVKGFDVVILWEPPLGGETGRLAHSRLDQPCRSDRSGSRASRRGAHGFELHSLDADGIILRDGLAFAQRAQ
jgi:hypothetical protein